MAKVVAKRRTALSPPDALPGETPNFAPLCPHCEPGGALHLFRDRDGLHRCMRCGERVGSEQECADIGGQWLPCQGRYVCWGRDGQPGPAGVKAACDGAERRPEPWAERTTPWEEAITAEELALVAKGWLRSTPAGEGDGRASASCVGHGGGSTNPNAGACRGGRTG